MVNNVCHMDCVTTDMDMAETLGLAMAVRDIVGGGIEQHFKNLFIGCGVHIDRMFQRRVANEKVRRKSPHLSDNERMEYYSG